MRKRINIVSRTRFKVKYNAFVLMWLLSACKAQENGSAKVVQEAQEQAYVLIDNNAYSGISEYGTEVIRDSKSLSAFYSKINRTRKPGLPVPNIDFSKEMVVAVCMGAQKGEQVPILKKIAETGSELSLILKLSSGNKEDIRVVSYPFYIYKIPYSSKKTLIKTEQQ